MTVDKNEAINHRDMQCKQYIQTLNTIRSSDELTKEELAHTEVCAVCHKKTQEYLSFLHLVNKEKQAVVSPFISTRIMAQLEKEHQPLFPSVQKALVYITIFLITLMLGFMSAYLLDENKIENEQEQLISQYFSSSSDGLILENNWLNKDFYEE